MTPQRAERLLDVLRQHAGGVDWELRPVGDRSRTTTFVATGSGRRLFVKWPTVIGPLRRLEELAVVPPIVGSGELDGAPYLVQDWVDHPVAERQWLRTHAGEVAVLMRRYQYDTQVQMSLAVRGTVSAAERRRRDLQDIDEAVHAAVAGEFRQPAVLRCVERFLRRGPSVPANGVVATHGDPNPHNFLRTDTSVLLIDWDGIEMADPLRDLGPFLWWCVPPERWPAVLEAHGAGVRADRGTIEWWAARTSLLVAVWLDAHTADRGRVSSFLADFVAAETGAGNPHLQEP